MELKYNQLYLKIDEVDCQNSFSFQIRIGFCSKDRNLQTSCSMSYKGF